MANSTMASLPPTLLESRQSILLGVFIMFIILETVAVGLRLLTKRICKLRYNWSDSFVVLGLITCISVAVVAIIDVQYGGVGLHTAYVLQTNPGGQIVQAKIIMGIPFVYLPSVVFPKLALIHLYLSLFVQKPFRITCWVVVGVIIANWVAMTVIAVRICVPFDQLWNPVPEGYCLDQNEIFRWASFANIITDLVLLLIPIPLMLKVQISVALRVGILFTLLTGSVGLGTSIVRFVEFSQIDADYDPPWHAADVLIWTTVEPGTYLIAACLPSYRPLLKVCQRRWAGKSSTNNSNSKTGRREYKRFAKESSYQHEQDVLKLQTIPKNVTAITAHSSSEGLNSTEPYLDGIRVTQRVDFANHPA